MYSVSQMARAINRTPPTVRAWTKEFGDFLSPTANPPRGEERQFTEEDAAVLRTVATLRDQGIEYADIIAALDRGERLEPVDAPPVDAPPAGKGAAADMARSFETALQLYQGQLSDLTERLIAAEVARAQAETELRLLREQLAAEEQRRAAPADANPPAPAADAPPAAPLSFREWWRQRRAK